MMNRIDAISRQHSAESEQRARRRRELKEYADEWAAWQSEADEDAARAVGAENAAALERLYDQSWGVPVRAAYPAAGLMVPHVGPAPYRRIRGRLPEHARP